MDRRGWAAALMAVLLVAVVIGCGALFARGARQLPSAPAPPSIASPARTSQPAAAAPTPTVAAPTSLPKALPSPTRLPPATTTIPSPPAATAAPQPEPPIALEDLPTPPILLRGSGPEVYLVFEGQRRLIVNSETFEHLGYREEDTLVAEYLLSAYGDGPRITRLLQGPDGQLYLMIDGVRHPIADRETLEALGAREGDVSPAPQALLLSFPLGQPLSSSSREPPPEPTPAPERVASAYHAIDGGPRLLELYTVGADGSRPRRLTHSAGNAESFSPAWSPDGREIAFTHCPDGSSATCSVAAMPCGWPEPQPSGWPDPQPGAGATPQPLAEPMTFEPSWSPDGRQVAYWSSRTLRLYVMDAEDADARELGAGRGPAWTPEGRIAFWAGEAEPYALSVLDPASGAVETVAGQVAVYDQRYHPWRVVQWSAAGNPWSPGGP